jgi:hypothetical protein
LSAGTCDRSREDYSPLCTWPGMPEHQRGCWVSGSGCGRQDRRGSAAQGQYLVPSEPPHSSHWRPMTAALAIGIGPGVEGGHSPPTRPANLLGPERSEQVATIVQSSPWSRHEVLSPAVPAPSAAAVVNLAGNIFRHDLRGRDSGLHDILLCFVNGR